MTGAAFKERLAAAAAAVEAELDALLSFAPKPGELQRPRRLLEAMRYSTLGGGKRLRAFLVIETARSLRRNDPGPVRAGAAIECLHAYSLIHDDLPAMDDDDLRRGRPTTHRAFDEATAILAGDALQTIAFEILSDPETDSSAETRTTLCASLARAAGLAGMVGGQMLDVAAETSATSSSVEEIARLQTMKTGALIRLSVEAGARLAGANPETFAALSEYGAAIGAAFQIADDLLDAEGDTATLGKRAGKDAGRHKATLVGALGAEGARRELAALVARAKAAIDAAGLGEAGDVLRATAEFVATRKS
jgi:farnesyl diphosphate synthase